MERLKREYNVSILPGPLIMRLTATFMDFHDLADQSLEKNRPFNNWRYSWGRPHTCYIMETRRHCQLYALETTFSMALYSFFQVILGGAGLGSGIGLVTYYGRTITGSPPQEVKAPTS